jgi:hypothetical protein
MSATTYYWEHSDDPSRRHRGTARAVASIAAAQGGEVGVIHDPDDDSPLRIMPVRAGRTVTETVERLRDEAARLAAED